MIQSTLSRFWSDFLTYKPETGMGYQVVEIRCNDGAIHHGMVFNSQIILTHAQIDHNTITDMTVLTKKQIPDSFLADYDVGMNV